MNNGTVQGQEISETGRGQGQAQGAQPSNAAGGQDAQGSLQEVSSTGTVQEQHHSAGGRSAQESLMSIHGLNAEDGETSLPGGSGGQQDQGSAAADSPTAGLSTAYSPTARSSSSEEAEPSTMPMFTVREEAEEDSGFCSNTDIFSVKKSPAKSIAIFIAYLKSDELCLSDKKTSDEEKILWLCATLKLFQGNLSGLAESKSSSFGSGLSLSARRKQDEDFVFLGMKRKLVDRDASFIIIGDHPSDAKKTEYLTCLRILAGSLLYFANRSSMSYLDSWFDFVGFDLNDPGKDMLNIVKFFCSPDEASDQSTVVSMGWSETPQAAAVRASESHQDRDTQMVRNFEKNIGSSKGLVELIRVFRQITVSREIHRKLLLATFEFKSNKYQSIESLYGDNVDGGGLRKLHFVEQIVQEDFQSRNRARLSLDEVELIKNALDGGLVKLKEILEEHDREFNSNMVMKSAHHRFKNANAKLIHSTTLGECNEIFYDRSEMHWFFPIMSDTTFHESDAVKFFVYFLLRMEVILEELNSFDFKQVDSVAQNNRKLELINSHELQHIFDGDNSCGDVLEFLGAKHISFSQSRWVEMLVGQADRSFQALSGEMQHVFQVANRSVVNIQMAEEFVKANLPEAGEDGVVPVQDYSGLESGNKLAQGMDLLRGRLEETSETKFDDLWTDEDHETFLETVGLMRLSLTRYARGKAEEVQKELMDQCDFSFPGMQEAEKEGKLAEGFKQLGSVGYFFAGPDGEQGGVEQELRAIAVYDETNQDGPLVLAAGQKAFDDAASLLLNVSSWALKSGLVFKNVGSAGVLEGCQGVALPSCFAHHSVRASEIPSDKPRNFLFSMNFSEIHDSTHKVKKFFKILGKHVKEAGGVRLEKSRSAAAEKALANPSMTLNIYLKLASVSMYLDLNKVDALRDNKLFQRSYNDARRSFHERFDKFAPYIDVVGEELAEEYKLISSELQKNLERVDPVVDGQEEKVYLRAELFLLVLDTVVLSQQIKDSVDVTGLLNEKVVLGLTTEEVKVLQNFNDVRKASPGENSGVAEAVVGNYFSRANLEASRLRKGKEEYLSRGAALSGFQEAQKECSEVVLNIFEKFRILELEYHGAADQAPEGLAAVIKRVNLLRELSALLDGNIMLAPKLVSEHLNDPYFGQVFNWSRQQKVERVMVEVKGISSFHQGQYERVQKLREKELELYDKYENVLDESNVPMATLNHFIQNPGMYVKNELVHASLRLLFGTDKSSAEQLEQVARQLASIIKMGAQLKPSARPKPSALPLHRDGGEEKEEEPAASEQDVFGRKKLDACLERFDVDYKAKYREVCSGLQFGSTTCVGELHEFYEKEYSYSFGNYLMQAEPWASEEFDNHEEDIFNYIFERDQSTHLVAMKEDMKTLVVALVEIHQNLKSAVGFIPAPDHYVSLDEKRCDKQEQKTRKLEEQRATEQREVQARAAQEEERAQAQREKSKKDKMNPREKARVVIETLKAAAQEALTQDNYDRALVLLGQARAAEQAAAREAQAQAGQEAPADGDAQDQHGAEQAAALEAQAQAGQEAPAGGDAQDQPEAEQAAALEAQAQARAGQEAAALEAQAQARAQQEAAALEAQAQAGQEAPAGGDAQAQAGQEAAALEAQAQARAQQEAVALEAQAQAGQEAPAGGDAQAQAGQEAAALEAQAQARAQQEAAALEAQAQAGQEAPAGGDAQAQAGQEAAALEAQAQARAQQEAAALEAQAQAGQEAPAGGDAQAQAGQEAAALEAQAQARAQQEAAALEAQAQARAQQEAAEQAAAREAERAAEAERLAADGGGDVGGAGQDAAALEAERLAAEQAVALEAQAQARAQQEAAEQAAAGGDAQDQPEAEQAAEQAAAREDQARAGQDAAAGAAAGGAGHGIQGGGFGRQVLFNMPNDSIATSSSSDGDSLSDTDLSVQDESAAQRVKSPSFGQQ